MKLIGMLDSPYVRRTAICLKLMGLGFEHEPLSVFRTFDAFARINPVVKAPTLVLDDGQVLMDSTLIIDYAAGLPGARRVLWPADGAARAHAYVLTGLALAASEKAVQLVYEDLLRPEDKRHGPWVARVTGQLSAALAALEAQLAAAPLSDDVDTWGVAEVTVAVVWQFIPAMLKTVDAASYARLNALSAVAEQHPLFAALPGA